MKPKLFDMFCCAGGATRGYQQAGFHVTGADLRRHPRYVGDAFIHGDALALDPGFIRENFDAVHASPPCQGLTEMNNDKSRHVNLIAPTRRLLDATGLPYTIENVRAARDHLVNPVSLFGTMFDCHMVTSAGQRFVLSRERLFEANWPIRVPHDPGAEGHPIANVFGGHLRCRAKAYRTGNGTGRTRDFIGEDKPTLARQLMGMPWASMGEMSEAIPPAYTEWLGRLLIAHLDRRDAA
ncbi:MAG: hypothetical protein WAW13_00590 [Minisyncoccia bacterium]